MMDSDNPGKIAASKIVNKIQELGVNHYKVFLPCGMDPDDFAKQYDLSFLDESIKSMISSSKKELYIQG